MNASSWSSLTDWLIAAMIIGGAVFTLIGSIGLLRLDDVFQRMHAPTKATTLGVGLILIAAAITFYVAEGVLNVHQFVITALLFVSAPVSVHLIARVALHQGLGDRTGLEPGPAAAAPPPTPAGGADPADPAQARQRI